MTFGDTVGRLLIVCELCLLTHASSWLNSILKTNLNYPPTLLFPRSDDAAVELCPPRAYLLDFHDLVLSADCRRGDNIQLDNIFQYPSYDKRWSDAQSALCHQSVQQNHAFCLEDVAELRLLSVLQVRPISALDFTRLWGRWANGDELWQTSSAPPYLASPVDPFVSLSLLLCLCIHLSAM